MLELVLLTLLGLGLGAFGTLVGAGGGFLLVPILLLIYPEIPPDKITAMSLFVVMANAGSGSVAYLRQRRVDLRTGWIFAAAMLPGAIAGSMVVGYIPRRLFDAIFAVAIGLIGLSLQLPQRSPTMREPLTGWGVVRREITDILGDTYVYRYKMWQGVAISAVVGFISTLLGIGGGVIHVPVMAVLLQFPVHIATATSHFVLALMAAEATGVHFLDGTLGWDRTLARSAAMALGAIVGAQVGAHFSHRVRGEAILRALGLALLLVAARLAFSAIRGT